MTGDGTPDGGTADARSLWRLFEPIHAVVYFAPEVPAAFEEAGLRGWWRGYFAGRAAPLGPVGPGPVTASFFSFAPATVARALPSVWRLLPPERALDLRRSGTRAALRRLLEGREKEAGRAAGLLAPVLDGLDCGGRVLAGANVDLGLPDDPLDALWQATTVLREHRGDGHVAALVAAGLDGCETLVLRTGIDLPRSELQPYRGWTDEEWDAAAARLTARGLLGPDGSATVEGRRVHAEAERVTDRAAARAWEGLALAAREELRSVLAPLAASCTPALRFPNPIGLPTPA
ncbi:SCO6745 family protein [Streptomyces olivoverticillatus]